MNDTLKMHGAMEAVLVRANGDVEVIRKDNIIVDVGFDFIADAIGKVASRPNVMGYIAVGTGSTAPATSQTALVTELARAAATYSHTTGTKTFTFTTTFAAGTATGAIQEAGVFNASSSGIIFDRVTFSVVNKGADDSLTITFTFTMS
ncbi:hypothetical protein [Magnetospirillum molischianum]|uniref:Putative BcepGomrgp18 n=1 Tax=Magnetospirillum molischianum DSM 120 TaxID=1150626 RepID=H8FY63_MAGML|nr:hypothetical protein [Magnetospirillum molischianum]CCG43301.1 putative BcepGomrgp18 [Magnetospirillum molischianum DSM 120]